MVMTPDQMLEWVAKTDRPQAGIDAINHIRTNPPARNVQGRRSNMSGRYPSKKMGFTIQFESNSGEICQIRECEVSDEVLEYYCQPPMQVKISWANKTGKNLAIRSTPDYFVLCSDGSAGWIEIKPETELQDWANKSDRFILNQDGSWSCPSAEKYASGQGLFYRVKSSSEFNQKFQRNFEYLSDFFLDDKTEIPPEKKKIIIGKVAVEQGITLASLTAKRDEYSFDDIMLLLARGELYIDLDQHLLIRPEQVPVFSNRTMSEVHLNIAADRNLTPTQGGTMLVEEGQRVNFDGKDYQIFQISESNIWLQNQDKFLKFPPQVFESLVKSGSITSAGKSPLVQDEVAKIIKSKDIKEIDRALERMQMIAPYLHKTDRNTPSTVRRWLKRYRKAEKQYGHGLLGLFDDYKDRGNRMGKIPKKVRDLIAEIIDKYYETEAHMNLGKAHAIYQSACEQEHLTPASLRTFCEFNATLNKAGQVRKREGKRAAYQVSIKYWYLEFDTPRHGDRPFEVAHIDHTELDVEIFDEKTGKSFGRPWLTLMIDAYTRRVLAIHLTFEPPSYRSVMMVMRECVSRFGRIPQTIVMDNGKEFKSRYFAALCAFYNITDKYRPPGQPRAGSVMERIFGTGNTQFIHTLFGNTQLMRDPRSTSPSHQAANNAVWTFTPFLRRLKEYFYEIYEQMDHPALFEPPRTAFQREIEKHGLRRARLVACDETFLMNTRPAPPKEVAKVVPTKGVKINNIFYWCEDFRSRLVEETHVPVRYEPFNIGIAYAYVNGQWHRCLSEYFGELNGLTEFEQKRISTEIQAKWKQLNQKSQLSAKVYRDFLVSVMSEQATLIMQRRDAEGRDYATEGHQEHNGAQDDGNLAPEKESQQATFNVDPGSIRILADM